TPNPVDHSASSEGVNDTPVIEAEVVVDESPPDTIMTVAHEAIADKVDDSAVVDGPAPSSAGAIPPETPASSVVAAQVFAPTDVPLDAAEAVTTAHPVAAAGQPDEQ
ncbi:hypothetical protein FOZ63_023762, partial [Perkinsus olseni]